jgi:hypothetical protein
MIEIAMHERSLNQLRQREGLTGPLLSTDA